MKRKRSVLSIFERGHFISLPLPVMRALGDLDGRRSCDFCLKRAWLPDVGYRVCKGTACPQRKERPSSQIPGRPLVSVSAYIWKWHLDVLFAHGPNDELLAWGSGGGERKVEEWRQKRPWARRAPPQPPAPAWKSPRARSQCSGPTSCPPSLWQSRRRFLRETE